MARLETAEGGTLEVHIDGEFVASWTTSIPEEYHGVICNMLESAVEYGERKKQQEIKKVLGINRL